jgi:hypothetical protein
MRRMWIIVMMMTSLANLQVQALEDPGRFPNIYFNFLSDETVNYGDILGKSH